MQEKKGEKHEKNKRKFEKSKSDSINCFSNNNTIIQANVDEISGKFVQDDEIFYVKVKIWQEEKIQKLIIFMVSYKNIQKNKKTFDK